MECLLQNENADTELLLVPKLTLEANKLHKEVARLKEEAAKSQKDLKQRMYQSKANGVAEITRDMKSAVTSPLTVVRRVATGPQGQLKGTVATDPHEVDEIVRTTMTKIYDGNASNPARAAAKYMDD